MERFKMIASGYVFFIKDGKILLSRRFHTGYLDGMYSLPAGHIEDNEPLRSGTCREAYEEIGISLRPEDLFLGHVMHRKEKDIRMDFFFGVTHWLGEPKNMEPEKCDDLRWFNVDHLPNNIIPYIKTAFINFQQKIFYSEFGW